jgi:hypothetical protein
LVTPLKASSAAAYPPMAMKAGTAMVSRFIRSMTNTLHAATTPMRIWLTIE